MSVRVIAGEFRGRVLHTAKGMLTRPLRAQVRESLFDILADRVDGAEVWDLFAGTGATGIEALSRGARRVTFVEKSNAALTVLRRNLDLLGDNAVQRTRVFRCDAWQPDVPEQGEAPPDVVFLDPPYSVVAEDAVRAACRAADLAARLAPGGVLCFHFEEGLLDEDDFDAHLAVDLRVWGRTAMALIQARAPVAQDR